MQTCAKYEAVDKAAATVAEHTEKTIDNGVESDNVLLDTVWCAVVHLEAMQLFLDYQAL